MACRILVLTRCSRPGFADTLESVVTSANHTTLPVIHVLMVDGNKLSDEQINTAAAQVGSHPIIVHYDPVPGDGYAVHMINKAVASYVNDDDWCVILDDDDRSLPSAFEALAANQDEDIVIWNADNPTNYRTVVNDIKPLSAGNCVGHVGWCNLGFKGYLIKRHHPHACGGHEDGDFMNDCLSDGIVPKYVPVVGYFYIPAACASRYGH